MGVVLGTILRWSEFHRTPFWKRQNMLSSFCPSEITSYILGCQCLPLGFHLLMVGILPLCRCEGELQFQASTNVAVFSTIKLLAELHTSNPCLDATRLAGFVRGGGGGRLGYQGTYASHAGERGLE